MIRRPRSFTLTDTLFLSTPLFGSDEADTVVHRGQRRCGDQASLGRASGQHGIGRGRIVEQLTHPLLEGRSEEHASELQSLMRISYAVFCLDKKKSEMEIHDQ